MKLIIDISEYNQEWIRNTYGIPQDIDVCIARAIMNGVPYESERKRGKWVNTGSGQECSVCHEIQYGYDNHRYFCPNCGADMRGEQDE